MNSYTTRLKKLRIENGLTIKELSRLLNISTTTLSKYENNITSPKSNTLFKICVLFNVRLDYLLGLNTLKTPAKPYTNNKFKL